jgi:hypothetical protein
VAHETKAEPETGKSSKQVTHLPLLAVSPADINRLSRELESIENTLLELGVRKDDADIKLPRTSRLIDQVVELNSLNLVHQGDRLLLRQFLQAVKQRAPVMHMSFGADPSAMFLEKLLNWLRREIHPQLLLTIGLQPTIGAGCIVRTTNHQFDLSLRQDFAKKRELLLNKLIPETKRPEAKAQV